MSIGAGYALSFFFSSRRRHTRSTRDWSSDVCSSDLGAPYVENGIHESPGGFDVVTAVEERGVAAQAIVDERGVSAARGITEAFFVTEVHGDIADAHFGSGALGAKGYGDAFFGLDVKDEAVGLDFALAKYDVWRAAKLNHDLSAALGEALAGAEVEGDAGPAPVVDQEASGDEGFGAGSL